MTINTPEHQDPPMTNVLPTATPAATATPGDFNDLMAEELAWKDDVEARTPPGWYGLATPDGWDQLVFDLHVAIKALFPDYQVYQIKEKFGTLRYYCSVETDPAVRALIRAAEVASASICETCGAPGIARNPGGWISTECDSHAPSQSP
jgi:hypothetical protein